MLNIYYLLNIKLYLGCQVRLVCEDVSHGEPDVLDLGSVVEELLALALLLRPPVPPPPPVNPGPLHVHRAGVLNKPGQG